MSNLLERAIIDAKALKEAAIKSAEKLVIEKYSEEVKHAVDQLLEQEEPAMGSDPLTDFADLTGEDPMADPIGDTDTADPSATQEPVDPDTIIGGLPDAFNSDEDEIISIKLDSLEADFDDDELGGPFAGDDEFSDDEIGIDITSDDDIDLETSDMTTDVDNDMSSAGVGVNISTDSLAEMIETAIGEVFDNDEIEEEIDLEALEEELNAEDLEEAVRVDFEPQKSGWAGTPEPIMREYESMLLAREQDSEVKEENEELRKNVAALQKENKTLTSAATKLQKQTEKYETAFDTLQEKLETMNVSNAKLLYINQALENASLNERQKRKLVEAISKAETVQEAKIVFDTMSETVTTTSDVRKDETLNEVMSRRSSLLVAARNEQKTKDANPLYNRLQKLAGITTK